MSQKRDCRIQMRLARYVARYPAERRLEQISIASAKRAQRAKLKARLVQYVARDCALFLIP